MERFRRWMVVPAAVLLILAAFSGVPGNAQVVPISPNFQPDPQALGGGTSGGTKDSRDCGFIADAPNLQIQLSEPFTYLRFSVQGDGQPTLLIEGPGGRFCGLGQPEISGFWKPGTYNIYVGDREKGNNPFTLSVTAKP